MSTRRIRWAIATITLAAIGLSACGGGVDDSSAPGAPTETVGGAASDTATTTTAPTTAVPTTAAPTTAAPTTTVVPKPVVPKPVVVVTYSVLGAAVKEIVGDTAEVTVIIPNGQDPHDYAASPKDVEAMRSAALVIANGNDLEEGLEDALAQTAAAGVPVFFATEHITVRELSKTEKEHDHDHGSDGPDDDGDHGSSDPHFWTSPKAMAEMAPALAAALGTATGDDLTAQGAAAATEFAALDSEILTIMSGVPAGRCKLVSGHESLGYFAEAYGCEVVGAIIPSLSSTAETSAKQLADLKKVIAAAGVPAIFTEVGTSESVATQLADESGVKVVTITTHGVPDGGTYGDFVRELARSIAGALTPTT